MADKTVLNSRAWSATLVRVAIVLVIGGIALMLAGAMIASAREGLVITGGVLLGAGVVAGLVGTIASWMRPRGARR